MAWPAVETLATITKRKQATIRSAVRDLERAGLVHTLRSPGGTARNGRGYPHRYLATLPIGADLPSIGSAANSVPDDSQPVPEEAVNTIRLDRRRLIEEAKKKAGTT